MVKTGGDGQPAETAQPGQPLLVPVLVQAGVAEPGRGPPAEADAAVVGRADVHRPVNEHVEAQPAAGAELQHPDAAFGAVVEHHRAHPARRGQVARHPGQSGPVIVHAVQSHVPHLPVNRPGRFSANAARPSAASRVARQMACISRSYWMA